MSEPGFMAAGVVKEARMKVSQSTGPSELSISKELEGFAKTIKGREDWP